jgi:hypothetical protein
MKTKHIILYILLVTVSLINAQTINGIYEFPEQDEVITMLKHSNDSICMKRGIAKLTINIPYPSTMYYDKSDWMKDMHIFSRDSVTVTNEGVAMMFGYKKEVRVFDVHGKMLSLRFSYEQNKPLDTTVVDDKSRNVYHGDTLISEGEDTYFYDSDGTVITGVDELSKNGRMVRGANYKYDLQGRINNVTLLSDWKPFMIYYAVYDSLNRMTSMTKTDVRDTSKIGKVIENYEFDKSGKLVRIKHHDENTTASSIDNKIVYINWDESTIITYNPDGLIKQIMYGYEEKDKSHAYVEDFTYQSLRQ